MQIPLTLENVLKHHEAEAYFVYNKLRTTKDINDKSFQWSYDYGIVLKKDLLNFILEKFDKSKIKEMIKEQLNGVISLSLTVSCGRVKSSRPLFRNKFPTLFIQKFTAIAIKNIQEQIKEDDRLNKLTDEEKEAESQEALNELLSMGHFMGMDEDGNIVPFEKKNIIYDMDTILDKISKFGIEGLTTGERKFLKEHGKR